MKKSSVRLVLAVLVLALVFGFMSTTSFAYQVVNKKVKNNVIKNASDIKVIVNGVELSFDTPIKIMNGRTIVPLRKIAEALEYEVEYIEKDKEIRLSKAEDLIKLILDRRDVYISNSLDDTDNRFPLDVAPAVYEGRTYVPLRVVAELCASTVKWDGNTKTITIDKIPETGVYAELTSEEGKLPYYYYRGYTRNNKPEGLGFLNFSEKDSSIKEYYRGEFKNGLPNGNGIMVFMGSLNNRTCSMGKFEDGFLVEGSRYNGYGADFLKDKRVIKRIRGAAGGETIECNTDEPDYYEPTWIEKYLPKLNAFQ